MKNRKEFSPNGPRFRYVKWVQLWFQSILFIAMEKVAALFNETHDPTTHCEYIMHSRCFAHSISLVFVWVATNTHRLYYICSIHTPVVQLTTEQRKFTYKSLFLNKSQFNCLTHSAACPFLYSFLLLSVVVQNVYLYYMSYCWRWWIYFYRTDFGSNEKQLSVSSSKIYYDQITIDFPIFLTSFRCIRVYTQMSTFSCAVVNRPPT